MRLPGFTIIELVVYMAILGVVSTAVMAAYTVFLRHQVNSRSIAELQSDRETAYRLLRDQLVTADQVELVRENSQSCVIAQQAQTLERTGLALSSAEKITIRNFTAIRGGASRSLSFWMLAAASATPETILDFGTTAPGRRWQVMTDAHGRIALNIHGTSIRGQAEVRDGNWHHVMLVYDSTISRHLTASSLALYVDGQLEQLSPGPGDPVAVNTDTTAAVMTLGGSVADTSFAGVLGPVKLWRKALDPDAVWPELLAAEARDRDDLELELLLEANLDDTSPRAHVVTGPADPSYLSRVRSYTGVTVFTFAPDSADAAVSTLWQKTFMATNRGPFPDACAMPGHATGWKKSGEARWQITGDAPFVFENDMLEINADIATRKGGRIIAVSGQNKIMISAATTGGNLCQIAPDISGFDTGDAPVAAISVRISSQVEPGADLLYFTSEAAEKSSPLQRLVDGQMETYFSYKNIAASGQVLWPNITAAYTPATGILKICTTSAAHCGNPDIQARQPLAAWGKVLGQIRYASNRQTHHGRKRFTFRLEGLAGTNPDHVLTRETAISTSAFFRHCPRP